MMYKWFKTVLLLLVVLLLSETHTSRAAQLDQETNQQNKVKIIGDICNLFGIQATLSSESLENSIDDDCGSLDYSFSSLLITEHSMILHKIKHYHLTYGKESLLSEQYIQDTASSPNWLFKFGFIPYLITTPKIAELHIVNKVISLDYNSIYNKDYSAILDGLAFLSWGYKFHENLVLGLNIATNNTNNFTYIKNVKNDKEYSLGLKKTDYLLSLLLYYDSRQYAKLHATVSYALKRYYSANIENHNAVSINQFMSTIGLTLSDIRIGPVLLNNYAGSSIALYNINTIGNSKQLFMELDYQLSPKFEFDLPLGFINFEPKLGIGYQEIWFDNLLELTYGINYNFGIDILIFAHNKWTIRVGHRYHSGFLKTNGSWFGVDFSITF